MTRELLNRVQLTGSNSKAVGLHGSKANQPEHQCSPLTPCHLRSCLKKASEVACLLRGGHLTVALQGESRDPQGLARIIRSIHNSRRLPLINLTLVPPSFPYHAATRQQRVHSAEHVCSRSIGTLYSAAPKTHLHLQGDGSLSRSVLLRLIDGMTSCMCY